MITLLQIQTLNRNGKTILSSSFANAPLKIANITEDKQQHLLELMLMSSSPGILNGDEYQLEITVAANCALLLRTQSFQRLFTIQQGLQAKGATQKVILDVQDHAFFCYIPHPSVPHKNAVFLNFNTIHLLPTSRLIWGEIISSGRKLNGETFSFTSLRLKTEIYISGKLVIKENMLAEPASRNLSAMGQWEGFSHQASLIIIDATANTNQLKEAILSILQPEQGIEFGLSEPAINGLVVRLLGYKGEQLYKCLQLIAGNVIKLMETKIVEHVV